MPDKRLALHPTQGMHLDDDGIMRFRQNKIVRTLLDTSKLDMNDLIGMEFTIADRIQFAQLIGYSLSGYAELPYVTDHAYALAEEKAAGVRRRMATPRSKRNGSTQRAT